MQNDVQKKDYALELHSEMKTIYENLDTFDFKNGIMRKRIMSKITYSVILIIIKEYIIFLLQ